MELFDDWQDVKEWLGPLDYEAFWREIAVFAPEIQSRESCDEQIAAGIVDEATVLDVLKEFVWLELIQRYDLRPRDRMPVYSLH